MKLFYLKRNEVKFIRNVINPVIPKTTSQIGILIFLGHWFIYTAPIANAEIKNADIKVAKANKKQYK